MNALKSLLGKYLSHLVGYVVAGAAVVSEVDPKALPPVGVLAISVAGLITTAAHHGYAAGAGVAAAQAAVKAVSDTLAAVAKPAALVLMVALTLPMLHGCALLTKVDTAVTSPSAQPYVIAAAQVAVATAEAKGISAAQINTVAKQALAADSGAAGTLAAVSGLVNTALDNLHLPAGDVAAITIVEAALSASIQTQVGSNATLAQTQAAVADVLNAVIAATGG